MQIVASMSDEKSAEKQTDDHACDNSPNLTLTTDQTICTNNQSPGAEPSSSPSNMPPTESITPTPNTDNLLDISVPKIALLGKEQAKKRLLAFSASKQSISPNCKRNKSKEEEKTDSDKMEPAKKCKKRLNPTEKAKAVIEEIEEIKKMEHARTYYGPTEQQTKIDARSRSNEWKSHHRKEHRRSRSDEKVCPRSRERSRYPVCWTEFRERRYDQETANGKSAKKIEECLDFRRQFLFETPSLLLHPLTFKDVSGKERIVPILSRRSTKTKPPISFSVTEKVESTPYNRKSVLDYVSKPYRDNISKIINTSARPLEKITSKSSIRRWYPQKCFSSIEKETECTVLENSLSLSFLQNYSDEEEQDKDDTKLTEKAVVKGASKTEMPQQKKPKERKHKHKIKKTKKKKEKKEKPKKKVRDTSNKKRKSEENDWVERPETKPPKVDVHNDAQKPKKSESKEKQTKKTPNEITNTEKVDTQDRSRSVEQTVRKRQHKRSSDRHSSSQKQDKLEKKEQSPIPEKKRKEEVLKKIPPHGKDCVKEVKKDNLKEVKVDSGDKPPAQETKEVEDVNAKAPAERELNTPDTDEYYSKWESDDELLNSSTSKQSDLYTDTSGINVSWESDADIPLCKSPVREFYKSESPHKAPVVEDFSPFRDRFINDRRRSRCSLDNPSPPYLEMPLNIRNYRDIQWEAERHNSDRINFRLENDQKCYSLYTEDSWEKDDYMTIKSEEMRLAEDRRSLMEERRQFEIEKRKLEELERERYYLRRSNVEENYNESYQAGEDRYRHKTYHFPKEDDRGSRKVSEILPKSVEHADKRASSEKRKRSRWQSIDVNELESAKVEVPKAEYSNKRNKVIVNDEKAKPEVLENEYEKFLKALNSQTKGTMLNEKKSRSEVKKRSKKVKSSSSSSSSSSSDDSDSSSSSSTTSSSSNSAKKRKEVKKKPVAQKPSVDSVKKVKTKQVFKIEDVERDLFQKEEVNLVEIPLPQVEVPHKPQDKIIPLPVPSPKVDSAVLNSTPSIADQISVMATIAVSPIKHDIPKEKPEPKDSPDPVLIKSDTSKLTKLAIEASVTDSAILPQLKIKKTSSPLMAVSTKSEMDDFNLNNNISVKNEEEVTTTEIVEHKLLPMNEEESVQTISDMPQRNSTSHPKQTEKNLVKRNEVPTNDTESSAKPIILSKPKEGRKKGENFSPVSETYRKLSSHELDHFSIKKCSKTTKERMSSIDKSSNNLLKQSPLSSPLDGFKRSVADSTISDEQLLQSNLVECTESPNLQSASEKSPRRMSLDERINQALGLSEEPKPIATTYSNNANYESQYYAEGFDSYVEEPRKPDTVNKRNQRSLNQSSKPRVLQVGNILQVVPTEDYSEAPAPPKRKTPLQQNKISNSTQKILQVGNMLQIVPTTSFPDSFEPEPEPENDPPPVPSTSTPIKSTFNAEMLIKQKAERRAEKDKRKQERQLKRKEKEKKRKERERRKQLKVKLQTEASIKQALILEDANLSDEQQANESQKPAQWPPIPQIVSNSAYRPSGKGILAQKREEREELFDKRKQVLFSDGIRPGEGTSPSGGEELSSPPPAPRKLPKEKRFKKIKLPKKEKAPKKKKVKVKVIRQSQFDDESEEDTLPPPPPPPGSPPPHIFPARIKEPVFNNIHPNLLASITNPPDTSYPPPAYRPNAPVVVPHHLPLHPPGPPPPVHRHHLPALPMLHHGSFNQSPSIIPHGNHR
uniref:Chromo domain-containing protein n=1 Tax=Photinus pyralis TaxID=7054 RepID=A0A1Y1LRH4_PHOPY